MASHTLVGVSCRPERISSGHSNTPINDDENDKVTPCKEAQMETDCYYDARPHTILIGLMPMAEHQLGG